MSDIRGHTKVFDLLDAVIRKMEMETTPNDTTNKLCKVKDVVFAYYTLKYNSNGNFYKEGTDYAMFLFDVGMLTGTVSYYTQHHSIRQDHIEDLNKIYKKYK